MAKIVSKAAEIGKAVKTAADKVDMTPVKDVTATLIEKSNEFKDAAIAGKEAMESKLHELDNILSQSISEYNNAYTLMNDKGISLYVERCRAVDSIHIIETIVNSIANHPKAFDADFEEIKNNRSCFTDKCDFADRELKAARVAASGAGAGIAAGASVAFMAPTAAMWVATTFGTASTGTAISTLSGAAATKAALAWLGGGALAAGGHGMAAGSALLALAGPIGWTIAGATLLSSILLFAGKKTKLNKQKNEEIDAVKKNTEAVNELDAKISALLNQTKTLRENLNTLSAECFSDCGKDYTSFTDEQKLRLGSLINDTKALSVLLNKTLDTGEATE